MKSEKIHNSSDEKIYRMIDLIEAKKIRRHPPPFIVYVIFERFLSIKYTWINIFFTGKIRKT